MKMLLTEKTKQEKIMNEVQKRRNLFGLGLTSLIAACSTDAENGAENAATETAPEAVKLAVTTVTVATTTIASDADGGASGRDDPNVTDAQATVTPEQRGLDSGDNLVLRIANGDHYPASVFASVYTGITDKHDLVFLSSNFGEATNTGGDLTGAMYIFWDIGNIAPDAVPANDAAAKTLALKHLKVAGVTGDTIISTDPIFYKDLGGEADQADMVFISSSNLNIIWDVTKHATTDTDTPETLLTLGASPRILQIKITGETTGGDFSFIKINNNDNYDMTMKRSAGGVDYTHILWDVANYYDADATAATPAIDLATSDNVTHGLLTIIDLTGDIMKAADEGGLTDIDGGGTNDLAFVYNGNTYILFGEKVANIDEESGTAISHTVDMGSVADLGEFYNKAGAGREVVTTTAPAEKQGFFDYDLDGTAPESNPKVENVGYRFATAKQNVLTTLADTAKEYDKVINPPAAGGALSEEAYWDIA